MALSWTDEYQNKNANMNYALKQSGMNQSQYVSDLLSRIGTPSANTGKILTEQDVSNELNRLGLNANTYNSANGSKNAYVNGSQYQVAQNGPTAQEQAKNSESYKAYQSYLANQGDAYEEQKAQLAQQAADSKRDSYIANEQAKQKMAASLRAQGLDGSGYAANAQIGLNANLGNAYRDIGNDLMQQTNALNAAQSEQQAQGQITLAQLYDTALQRAQEQARQDEQTAYERSQNDYALALQQAQAVQAAQEQAAQQAKEEQAARAQVKLGLGLIDNDVQQTYGFTKADWDRIMAEQQAAEEAKKRVTSTSSASNATVPTDNNNYDWAYSNGFTGTTYAEAVKYLEDNNVDGAAASSIMGSGEFDRKKQTNSAYKQFATYQDYLQNAIEYILANN